VIVVDLHVIFDGLICLYIACIIILVSPKQFCSSYGRVMLPMLS